LFHRRAAHQQPSRYKADSEHRQSGARQRHARAPANGERDAGGKSQQQSASHFRHAVKIQRHARDGDGQGQSCAEDETRQALAGAPGQCRAEGRIDQCGHRRMPADAVEVQALDRHAQ